jgi:hypothetical protein
LGDPLELSYLKKSKTNQINIICEASHWLRVTSLYQYTDKDNVFHKNFFHYSVIAYEHNTGRVSILYCSFFPSGIQMWWHKHKMFSQLVCEYPLAPQMAFEFDNILPLVDKPQGRLQHT